MNKKDVKHVPGLPWTSPGYHYKIYLNTWGLKKLQAIREKSGRAKQHLILYLIQYAIDKGYPEQFTEFQFVPESIEFPVYANPYWAAKMADLAWKYRVRSNSMRHFSGLCVLSALRDKPTAKWVSFFYYGKDLEERVSRYLQNYIDEQS